MHNVKRIVLHICKSESADDHTNDSDHATLICRCVAFFFMIRLLYAALTIIKLTARATQPRKNPRFSSWEA